MADQNSLENADPVDLELGQLFKKLSENPATRKDLLRLVKKANPNQPIPEIDVEASMQTFAKPYIDEIGKMKLERMREKTEAAIERSRAALKEKGYSAEDIAAVEKLMTEKQIPSHETAAEHFRMTKQLATPTPTSLSPTGVNTLPIDRKAIKEAGGIRNWSRMEAHKAADEIIKGRVKLH